MDNYREHHYRLKPYNPDGTTILIYATHRRAAIRIYHLLNYLAGMPGYVDQEDAA